MCGTIYDTLMLATNFGDGKSNNQCRDVTNKMSPRFLSPTLPSPNFAINILVSRFNWIVLFLFQVRPKVPFIKSQYVIFDENDKKCIHQSTRVTTFEMTQI